MQFGTAKMTFEDDATTDFMPFLEGNPLEVDDLVAVAYTSSAQSVCLGKIIGG